MGEGHTPFPKTNSQDQGSPRSQITRPLRNSQVLIPKQWLLLLLKQANKQKHQSIPSRPYSKLL